MCGKSIYWLSVVLVLGIAGATTAQNVDPALVGWWTFDEGAGNAAGELSGKSVEGTFFGGPTWGFDGDHRGILLFDASSSTGTSIFRFTPWPCGSESMEGRARGTLFRPMLRAYSTAYSSSFRMLARCAICIDTL